MLGTSPTVEWLLSMAWVLVGSHVWLTSVVFDMDQEKPRNGRKEVEKKILE